MIHLGVKRPECQIFCLDVIFFLDVGILKLSVSSFFHRADLFLQSLMFFLPLLHCLPWNFLAGVVELLESWSWSISVVFFDVHLLVQSLYIFSSRYRIGSIFCTMYCFSHGILQFGSNKIDWWDFLLNMTEKRFACKSD